MTLLSLAMIVRDEEARLADFLAHHRLLVDEMVVVDTGSRDSTVAVARDAGAVVLEETWADDFAAARNAGLAAARGTSILLLDADEKVAARDFESVRKAAALPETAWLLETRNYLPHTNHLEWQPLTGQDPVLEAGAAGYFAARRISLFPRNDSLRFSGRLHESVLPSLRKLGWPLAELSVPIHHYGHLDGESAARRRERDRRLAQMKVAENPGDSAAHLEWASVLLEEGRADEALPLLEMAAAGTKGQRAVVRAQVLLGRLHLEAGRTEAAEDLLCAAVEQDQTLLFGWLEWIRCRGARGDWNGVLTLSERALAQCGADHALLLQQRLRALAHAGRLEEAARVSAVLVDRFPQWTEIVALHRRLQGMVGGS